MSKFEITEKHAALGKACAACRAPFGLGDKIKRRPQRAADMTDPDVAIMTGGNVAIHDGCPSELPDEPDPALEQKKAIQAKVAEQAHALPEVGSTLAPEPEPIALFPTEDTDGAPTPDPDPADDGVPEEFGGAGEALNLPPDEPEQ